MNEDRADLTKHDRADAVLRYGLIFYILFLFAVVLIRSIISGMTYDEAYTYLDFGIVDLFNVDTLIRLYGKTECIANNHWMNSVLIHLCHLMIRADYNEFVIRLPSLAFFVVYLISIGYGYRRKLFSLTALLFLVSNYYLLEFYGLARGYGMANTCVFLACLSYNGWRGSDYAEMKHLNGMMLFLSMAVFSNTIVLLLYPAFGLICLLRIIQKKALIPVLKKSGVFLFLFLAFALLMVKYHMNISSEGKPLFTGGEQNFFTSVVVGYTGMFTDHETLALVLAYLALAGIIAALVFLRKELLGLDFSLMLIIFVITNILLEMIMHKGYITNRVLLPFYAFVVLCLDELFSGFFSRLEKRFGKICIAPKKVILTGLGILLIVSAVARTNLYSTRDWNSYYIYRTWVIGSQLTGVEYDTTHENPVEIFYQQKIDKIKEDYLSELGESALEGGAG